MQPLNRLFNVERTRPDPATSQNPETLWVTGSDRNLLKRLVRITGQRPTVILSSDRPHDADTFLRHTLELIADAIQSRDVRRIVLCGQPGDVPFRGKICQATRQATKNEFERSLQRTSGLLERQQHAQDHLRTQLRQIESNATLATTLSDRDIELHAVFYVPEHDSLLTYVRAEDQFIPTSEATVRQLLV